MSIKNLFNGLNNYSSQLDFKAKAIQVNNLNTSDLSSNSISTNNLYLNNKLLYETVDISLNLTGALSVSINVKLSRVGNQVSILLPYLSGLSVNTPGQFIISSTPIPSTYRKQGEVLWGLMHVLNNDSVNIAQGSFYISMNGYLYIYNGYAQGFTPNTAVGFREQTLNYSI